MSNWNIYTPEGFRDVLFEECYAKRNIEDKIRKMLMQRGFFEIETPSLEFYDAFSPESGLISQETMFKFFDQQGRILVMRPDATIPAARVAATKFGEKDFPLKISYVCNTYRFNELGGGKQKEFTAAGVEIIGEANPEADAEVIAAAIEVIRSLGIDNFQVDIGQMQFFKGIMEDSGLSD
ncbi:MAG: ATP phosphoribosyltransferase regulatory subunit, partial [Eubacteriales bacterium]|nr:ATP phosphoribosyltransferase regulatory subunit [Eubacteriales bacterium]